MIDLHAILIIALALNGQALETINDPPDLHVASVETPWWVLINAQVGHISTSSEAIRQAFKMQRDAAGATRYRADWRGAGFPLQAGVVVSKTSLAVTTSTRTPKWMALTVHFAGRCVSFDQVRQHYPDIAKPTPSSLHSREQSTTWTVDRPQATIYFEIQNFNAVTCLKQVTLTSNKSQPGF